MCGICGKFSSTERVDSGLIEEMCARLAHRGPDDQGTFIAPGVGLGNRRLAILDLSAAGHQPMSDPGENLWITYNGEVYNYRELREELVRHGYKFRTNTDTEVVLDGYQQWGPSCLERFNGMFAIALWDERKRELFLARDRLGIKPLYYYFDGVTLIFASEIKAILADPRVHREINPKGLINYFTFGHAVAPDTMLVNIKKLPPGYYLVCSDNGNGGLHLSLHCYWKVPLPGKVYSDAGEEYYSEKVHELLKRSVQRQLIADVPVGVFLSGGIDSSVVTGLMSSLVPGRVKTFSIGFPNGPAYNELNDARAVAQHWGTEHYELMLSETDLTQALWDLVYHFDEPFGDAASFPTYLLSRFARSYVTVALSGEGGDEVFGGYRRYVAECLASEYPWLAALLGNGLTRAALAAIPKLRKWRKAVEVMAISDPVERYASWLSVFNDGMKAELFSQNMAGRDSDSLDTYRNLWPQNGMEALDRLLYVDQQTWLPDTYLEKVDKASMAVGLEVRVPFLDHEVVELASTIPAKYKVKGLSTKYILKKAFASLLPPSTLRKRKHGFAVPTELWIRGQLRGLVSEVLFDQRARSRGLFDHKYIEKLYRWHLEGKGSYHRHLWLLVIFELWCQQYLDQGTPSPSGVIV